jgi:hypothetical protein
LDAHAGLPNHVNQPYRHHAFAKVIDASDGVDHNSVVGLAGCEEKDGLLLRLLTGDL